MFEHRALVVDDDLDIRVAIADILETEGFVVAQASNGAEALEALRETTFSLVLLDMRMPVLGGEEVLRTLCPLMLGRTPVVAMSAQAQTADALRGARSFIRKPFTVEALMEIVATTLTLEAGGHGATGTTAQFP